MDHVENSMYRAYSCSTEKHKKFSDTYRPMDIKYLKHILTYCIVLSTIELTCIIQVYKSMFPIKNGKISFIYFFITGSHKSFPMHGVSIKRILTYLYYTKYNEFIT